MRISNSLLTGTILILMVATFAIYKFIFPEVPTYITGTVETGTVRELVSVSGFAEAKQVAKLSFPSTGIITAVLVEEGQRITEGEVLATIASTELVAERETAVSTLKGAEANFDKLVAGPRAETLALANTTLEKNRENLTRTISEENKKVANAKSNLHSTGLTAVTTDPNEDSLAPIVSGTYRCENEGKYIINIYSSASQSGLSFRLTGLETDNGEVSTDQPTPLGVCGLFILFTDSQSYSGSTWTIEIPNTRNNNYTTLKNNYDLAVTTAQNNIATSKDALLVAEKENSLSTAGARSEEVREATAKIEEAKSRIKAIDARLADRSIVAPFAGTVTNVDIVAGENAPLSSVITVLADNSFTLKARIPEIDITKLVLEQKVEIIFDAVNTETLIGKLIYISPIATQIDGVAYFETTIELTSPPSWLRAGLNADIDIVTTEKNNILRLPKRFIITENNSSVVLVKNETTIATTSIKTIFEGNDGFIEISGIPAGTIVVAP